MKRLRTLDGDGTFTGASIETGIASGSRGATHGADRRRVLPRRRLALALLRVTGASRYRGVNLELKTEGCGALAIELSQTTRFACPYSTDPRRARGGRWWPGALLSLAILGACTSTGPGVREGDVHVRQPLADAEASIPRLRQLAGQGDSRSQYALGGTKALYWFRRAAQYRQAALQGLAAAQLDLGVLYQKRGPRQDHEEAVKWLRMAADQGVGLAQFNLGLAYTLGQGVPRDYAEAERRYRLAAEQGVVPAQINLGAMYQRGQGVPRDLAKSAKWYRLAAEQGDRIAQYNLALAVGYGRGVPRDVEQARKWYRLSAEQGFPDAQNNLGTFYLVGVGVEPDYAEALKWYRRAAEQGHPRAQHSLGYMFRTGRGVGRDHAEAVKWYRMAAEQGFARAQVWLGLMLEYGQGVRRDCREAATWYRRAAEQGNGTGQHNLALLYAAGSGVPRDYAETYKWLVLAVSRVDDELRSEAVDLRDKTAASITREQIDEGLRRAREWEREYDIAGSALN